VRPLADLLTRHALPDQGGGKDDRGTVVVIGGPPSCPGAVLLAGTAALRTGSGRVQLVVDPAVAAAVAAALPEALVIGWDQTTSLPEAVAEQVESADAVVVGPGHDAMDHDIVRAIVDAAGLSVVVLDAGALPGCLTLPSDAHVVIAPNPTEAAKLVGAGDESTLAAALSAELRRPVAVRGPITVVSDDGQAWAFDSAPRGLGTPGSGDVFTGVLGALLGSGMPAVGALGWAVRLHASAAARLASSTPIGYLAHEIAAQLPYALAEAHNSGS
jgi:ADP-dependent NAD(P)H-hydrate dehydratase